MEKPMNGEAVGHDKDGFPWSIGVFDAHCHPTDTMSMVPDISKMKAKSLIIMATRKQDQHLVEEVAADRGIVSEQDCVSATDDWRGIVPSFGWHPWFSHQIYDDGIQCGSVQGEVLDRAAKIAHYQSVLIPKSDDEEFLASLPDPMPMSSLIAQIRERLEKHPLALIGEIGLDRSFRIPEAWLPGQVDHRDDELTPGGREGRRLSPYRVSMDHQRILLAAQLKLAGEMNRAVSVHGVQAHGAVHDTLHGCWNGYERAVPSKRDKKPRDSVPHAHANDHEASKTGSSTASSTAIQQTRPFPPRVCLHSYSGPPETLKQYFHPSVPIDVFFSFSTAINFSTSAALKTEEVIKALPDVRIMIESDLHQAGPNMDEHLKDVAMKICEIKNWPLEEGVMQLATNWKSFVFGGAWYLQKRLVAPNVVVSS